MTATPRPIVKLPRTTKGKRSQFYDDPAVDQLMTFFLELMAEFSSVRERLDTIERLLDAKGAISRDDIEAYKPDAAVEAERSEWNNAFIRRVLRFHDPR